MARPGTAGSDSNIVPPGIQTGVYYIPVGNLPFDTTWQQLKDFVREVATVDHVAIFGNSTSGWVKVTGRDNFKKAFAKLNGGLFKDRFLTAMDKNEHEALMIRDLHAPPEHSMQEARSHSQAYYTGGSPNVSAAYGSEGMSMMSPTMASEMSYTCSQWSSPMSAAAYLSPGSQYSSVSPTMGSYGSGPGPYPGSPVASYQPFPSISMTSMDSRYPADYGDTYTTQASSGYSQYPYAADMATSSMVGGSSTSSSSRGSGFVPTERRKLIIKDIDNRATPDQLNQLVQETANKDQGADGVLEVNMHRSGEGNSKSKHAYVLCASADVAEKLQKELHKKKFKGARLTVRFTTEGVSMTDASGITSAYGGSSGGWAVPGMASVKSSRRKDDKRRKERDWEKRERDVPRSEPTASGPGAVKWDPYEQDDYDYDVGRASSSKDQRSSRKQIVIADGSSSRTRR